MCLSLRLMSKDRTLIEQGQASTRADVVQRSEEFGIGQTRMCDMFVGFSGARRLKSWTEQASQPRQSDAVQCKTKLEWTRGAGVLVPLVRVRYIVRSVPNSGITLMYAQSDLQRGSWTSSTNSLQRLRERTASLGQDLPPSREKTSPKPLLWDVRWKSLWNGRVRFSQFPGQGKFHPFSSWSRFMMVLFHNPAVTCHSKNFALTEVMIHRVLTVNLSLSL